LHEKGTDTSTSPTTFSFYSKVLIHGYLSSVYSLSEIFRVNEPEENNHF